MVEGCWDGAGEGERGDHADVRRQTRSHTAWVTYACTSHARVAVSGSSQGCDSAHAVAISRCDVLAGVRAVGRSRSSVCFCARAPCLGSLTGLAWVRLSLQIAFTKKLMRPTLLKASLLLPR